MKHRYPAINSGGLLSAWMFFLSFYVAWAFDQNVDGFRLGCAAMGCLFGGLAWVSFQKYGMWIEKGER